MAGFSDGIAREAQKIANKEKGYLSHRQFDLYRTGVDQYNSCLKNPVSPEVIECDMKIIDDMRREMPGDGDGEVTEPYVDLSIMFHNLQAMLIKKRIQEVKNKMLECLGEPTPEHDSCATELFRQKYLEKQNALWLHYFGADVPG